MGGVQIERRGNLQYLRRVGHILRRRTPMAILAEPVSARGGELLHEAEHWRADALGVLAELVHVDLVERAVGSDLRRGVRRDEAETSRHGCQPSFEFTIFPEPMLAG